MARLRQVIDSDERVGLGSLSDPARVVTRYYDLDGTLLQSHDPWQLDRDRIRDGHLYEALSNLRAELDATQTRPEVVDRLVTAALIADLKR